MCSAANVREREKEALRIASDTSGMTEAGTAVCRASVYSFRRVGAWRVLWRLYAVAGV